MAPYSRLTPAALLLLTGTLLAQPTLRVDVNLVQVPVTVTDHRGQIISGLDRSRFHLFEEGVAQPIASFSTEDLPASIGLVLDVSGSMRRKFATARAVVRALFAGTDERDEAFLMTCADRPDVQRSLQRLQSATTGGWTALIDSVQLTLDRMRRPRNARKVLVVVSDGQDNHSRYTKAELISRAVESDAQIYTVAVRERPGARKPIELTEEDRGLILLSDLAQATGGQYFAIDAEEEAPAAAAKILSAMHNQYLIGYYPTDPQRPGRRRIQVKLDSSGVRLYARSVYVATAP